MMQIVFKCTSKLPFRPQLAIRLREILPDRGSAAEVSRVQRKFDRQVPTASALLRENQSGGRRAASGCIG
ncbi:hypothetical protein, partial [Mesorhizobium sp.]|uniref:hypothetical protein n=1 Tax=Mesorhizobium sp. TaxID=1871066 RepID=UPI0025E2FF97